MSPVIQPLREIRRRGAALVEFALVFPLLFLVIATVWEWSGLIREANVLIEATRHGARVIAGISANPAGGRWCDVDLPYDSGEISCRQEPVPPGLVGVEKSSVQTSLESVCQYLDVAGANRDDWLVRLQLEQAFNFADALGLPSRAFRVAATRDPAASRPCIVCLFGFLSGSLRNEGSSVFPMQWRCPDP